MNIKIAVFLIFLTFNNWIISAQVISKDSVIDNCKIMAMNPKEKTLGMKPYFYSNPCFFQVQNSTQDYISFQLEKRKGSKICIYIKVLIYNTCIKKGEVLDVTFSDNFKYSLKNDYPINCDGFIVVQLSRKEMKLFLRRPIKSFVIYSFQKDYEFQINKKEGLQIRDNINFLKTANFKKKCNYN